MQLACSWRIRNIEAKSEEPKKTGIVKVGDKAAITDLEALGRWARHKVMMWENSKKPNYAIKVEVGKLLELKKQLAILKAMKGKIFIFRFCLYKQYIVLRF